jgi:hypothetical protein
MAVVVIAARVRSRESALLSAGMTILRTGRIDPWK